MAGGGAGRGEMDDDQLVAAAKEKRLRLKKLKVSPAFIDKNQWLALKKLSNDASISRLVVCTETPLVPLSTQPIPTSYRPPEALAKGHIIPFAPTEVCTPLTHLPISTLPISTPSPPSLPYLSILTLIIPFAPTEVCTPLTHLHLPIYTPSPLAYISLTSALSYLISLSYLPIPSPYLNSYHPIFPLVL